MFLDSQAAMCVLKYNQIHCYLVTMEVSATIHIQASCTRGSPRGNTTMSSILKAKHFKFSLTAISYPYKEYTGIPCHARVDSCLGLSSMHKCTESPPTATKTKTATSLFY